MGKPTLYQRFWQGLGKAVRETGQALDRAGIKGQQLVTTQRLVGDDPVIYQDHLSRHRQQMPLLRRGRPVVSSEAAFLAPCATLIGSVYVGAGSSVFYKSILRADHCDNAEAFDPVQLEARSEAQEQLESDRDAMETSESSGDETRELVALDQDETDCHSPRKHPSEWDLDGDRFLKTNSNATGGGIFIGEETNIQDGCIIDATRDHTVIGNGVTVGHLASIHSARVGDHCLIGMGALLQEGVVVQEESFVAAGANVPRGTMIGSGELWVGSPARKIRDLTKDERDKLHYQADAYVGVASALKDGMVLGGNLPESLSQYLYHAHDNDDVRE